MNNKLYVYAFASLHPEIGRAYCRGKAENYCLNVLYNLVIEHSKDNTKIPVCIAEANGKREALLILSLSWLNKFNGLTINNEDYN